MIAATQRRIKIAVDPRGKIKTGKRVWSDKAKCEVPRALDYFNCEAFPEVVALYGNEPRELVIAVPSDSIQEVFDDRFALYGANKQAIRKCDGITCLHRVQEKYGNDGAVVGEETECWCVKYGFLGNEAPEKPWADHGLTEQQWEEMGKRTCAYTMNLKAFILNPADGKLISTLPHLFETGSRNSGGAVLTALQNLSGLTTLFFGEPKIAYIPMRLWVKMVSGKDDAKLRFPIWELTPPTNVGEIIERLRSVGRALGWDESLMKRIEASRLLTEGDLEHDLKPDIQAEPQEPNYEALTLQDIVEYMTEDEADGVLKQINAALSSKKLSAEEAKRLMDAWRKKTSQWSRERGS